MLVQNLPIILLLGWVAMACDSAPLPNPEPPEEPFETWRGELRATTLTEPDATRRAEVVKQITTVEDISERRRMLEAALEHGAAEDVLRHPKLLEGIDEHTGTPLLRIALASGAALPEPTAFSPRLYESWGMAQCLLGHPKAGLKGFTEQGAWFKVVPMLCSPNPLPPPQYRDDGLAWGFLWPAYAEEAERAPHKGEGNEPLLIRVNVLQKNDVDSWMWSARYMMDTDESATTWDDDLSHLYPYPRVAPAERQYALLPDHHCGLHTSMEAMPPKLLEDSAERIERRAESAPEQRFPPEEVERAWVQQRHLKTAPDPISWNAPRSHLLKAARTFWFMATMERSARGELDLARKDAAHFRALADLDRDATCIAKLLVESEDLEELERFLDAHATALPRGQALLLKARLHMSQQDGKTLLPELSAALEEPALHPDHREEILWAILSIRVLEGVDATVELPNVSKSWKRHLKAALSGDPKRLQKARRKPPSLLGLPPELWPYAMVAMGAVAEGFDVEVFLDASVPYELGRYAVYIDARLLAAHWRSDVASAARWQSRKDRVRGVQRKSLRERYLAELLGL